MDDSMHCANAVPEDKCCEPYTYDGSRFEEITMEHKQCAFSCMKEITEGEPQSQDVLDASISMKDDLVAQAVGNSTGGVLVDQGKCLSGLDVNADRDGVVNSGETGICQEFCESIVLDDKVKKGLRKCATFPSSAEEQQQEGVPLKAAQALHPSSSGSPYRRSQSLPASLVSALKGGRAQKGINLTEKLNVKWAPEVYEPPSSSMSHTVKSYQQRPKSKKRDNHKHKNNKGKSSRGSGSERKTKNRKNTVNNISDPLDMRLELNGNCTLLDEYASAAKGDMDVYAIDGQDSKCSTSFLKEGFAKNYRGLLSLSQSGFCR